MVSRKSSSKFYGFWTYIDIVEVDVDVEWFWHVWDRFLDTQFVGNVASGSLPRISGVSGPIRRGSIDALRDLRGDVSGGGLGAENQTAVEHLTRKMS